MLYENINVASAKNNLIECLNTLNIEKSKTIMDELKNNEVWNAKSKETFFNGLNKLDDNVLKLKNCINEYIDILNKIEQYQILQNQNLEYSKLINSKEYQLRNYNNNYNNMIDKTTKNARELNFKIRSIEKEINMIKEQKNSNTINMLNLEKIIKE